MFSCGSWLVDEMMWHERTNISVSVFFKLLTYINLRAMFTYYVLSVNAVCYATEFLFTLLRARNSGYAAREKNPAQHRESGTKEKKTFTFASDSSAKKLSREIRQSHAASSRYQPGVARLQIDRRSFRYHVCDTRSHWEREREKKENAYWKIFKPNTTWVNGLQIDIEFYCQKLKK